MNVKILQKLFLFCFLFPIDFLLAQNPLLKQWDYRFGGTDDEYFTAFQRTSDGGYILGGYSDSNIGGNKTQIGWGEYDYWIVKIDASGNYQWDKRFGGTWFDYLYSVKQTKDGGYILGGGSSSFIGGDVTQDTWGGSDYWIVKTDSLGIFQWDGRYGGFDNEVIQSLQQTSDGGYILGGSSDSENTGNKTQPSWGQEDYWIVKIDSLGIKQWDKRFGGTEDDYLSSLQQTNDGGFILGGHSYSGISGDKTQTSWGGSDYWMVKTDSLGIKQWDKRFGGTSGDWHTSVQQTTDNGYVFGGQSSSGISGDKSESSWGGTDFWIVKTDSLGIKQWDKRFGGTNIDDQVGSISQTFDSGYLISGTSYSSVSGDKTETNLGVKQTWIIKSDSIGVKQWDKTIFTVGNDQVGDAIQAEDGCYAIINYTSADVGGYKTEASWNNSNDYWIVKFCDTTNLPLPFSASDELICENFCVDFFDQSTNNPTSWQWIFSGGLPSSSFDQNPTNICYNDPGSFDVTLITINVIGNDTLVLSNYITVYPTPVLPSISQTGYTLTSTSATSYQWQFNSVNIAGATNQTYQAMESGLYTIVITDDNGCSASSSLYVLISGIDDVFDDTNVLIYPNPSNGNFIVEWFNCQIEDLLKIEVRNTLGKIVFSSEEKITNHNFKKEIDLHRDAMYFISTGVYLIEISNGNPEDNKQDLFSRKKIMITK